MSIYSETHGRGSKDIVLIHGWGMSGNVWEPVTDILCHNYRITILDLPGYGRSAQFVLPQYTLESLADELVSLVPPGATVLGWSLGGMIAMQMALRYPNAFDRLILVATSPQFQLSADWPHAVDTRILENFASELATSYKDTIQQFLAIQALGSEHAREEIRLLRDKVFRDGEPDPNALRQSLRILQTANLRDKMQDIAMDTLIICGERDRLVPIAAAKRLAQSIEHCQLRIIKGASHAPFISHQEAFIQALEAFLAETL
ncbi:pimeloyl-ACP methyl ester esterase BioH [Kaarinaea lacus]